MNASRMFSVWVLLFAVICFSGCGGGADRKPTGKVKGKVTFNGQPVSGGTITFSPASRPAEGKGNEPGKAGSGTVGSDGTFTITTYTPNDGAVVGKHTVTYFPPSTAEEPGAGHSDETAAANAPPASPFAGLVPKTPEVEIKAGENTLDIELVKKG